MESKDTSEIQNSSTKCGCDPGIRTVVTFVFDEWPNEFIKKHIQQKDDIKKKDPNYILKQERTVESPDGKTRKDSNLRKITLSSGEFYNNSKINESIKHTLIEEKLAGIDILKRSCPTNKTVDISKYNDYIRYVLTHVKQFRDFAFQSNARKWRFTRYCNKNSLYSKLALQLTNCRVGFGNVSGKFANSVKGKRCVPIEDMKLNLKRRHVDLTEIDEFRTSKICHNCFYSDPSITSVLDSYNYSNKPIIFPDPTKKLGLEHKPKYSAILACFNCGTIINRDVNAAQNILSLMDHRADVFKRMKYDVEKVSKDYIDEKSQNND